MKNLYAILGVEPTASAEEIKRAYRIRTKATHPDKNKHPDAAEMFKEVQTAFDILSDKDKREAYDRGGDAETAGQGMDRIETMLFGSIQILIRCAEPKVDILAALRGQIIGCIETKAAELHEAEEELERLKKFTGKVRRMKDGPNIFETAVAKLVSETEVQIFACKADLEDGKEMMRYLTHYRASILSLFGITATRGTWEEENPFPRQLR